MQVHRTMIVSAAIAPTCRQLSETIAGPSGSGMWVTGLSPTGEAPATHYISAGLIQADFAGLMPLTTHGDGIATTPGNAAVVAHLASKAGMSVTAAQVQALFDASDTTEQTHQQVLDRLGLQMASAKQEKL